MRARRRSWMTICARCGRCSRRGRGRFSGRSIGRASSASSISGSRASRSRSATASGAAAGSSSRVWATRAPRRGVGVLQADAGSALGHRALPVVAGRAAGHVGLGSPGRAARARRAPDGRVRRALRPAAGRLALLRAAPTRRPRARSSASRATWRPTSSRAGVFANERDYQHQLDALVCQGQRAHAQDAARAPGRPAADRARGDGGAAGVPGSRPALGDPGPGRSLPAL